MLSNINFIYTVDADYRYSNNCDEYGCHDEGICRCGMIEYESISTVDVRSVADKIYENIFKDDKSRTRHNLINNILYGTSKDIDLYCIDRIIRSRSIWESEKWHISIDGGYYGQEIESIQLEKSFAIKLELELNKVLFELETLEDKINYLLILENGSLLEKFENCTYEVITIDKFNIILPNEKHSETVSNKNNDFYSDKNYTGIRGLVDECNGKFKIVDGYHRILTTCKSEVKVILIKKES